MKTRKRIFVIEELVRIRETIERIKVLWSVEESSWQTSTVNRHFPLPPVPIVSPLSPLARYRRITGLKYCVCIDFLNTIHSPEFGRYRVLFLSPQNDGSRPEGTTLLLQLFTKGHRRKWTCFDYLTVGAYQREPDGPSFFLRLRFSNR